MLSIKISSGKFKNRSIFLPDLPTTRPSKSIVRQAFLDTIDMRRLDIAEVFAGSGCVGIEALSRGAKNAFFFEQNAQAIGILRKNIRTLNLQNTSIVHGDSFEKFLPFMQSYSGNSLVVYLDPPFNIRKDQAQIYEKLIKLITPLDPKKVSFVVIEHYSKTKFANEIGEYTSFKVRKFGKTTLTYYQPSSNFFDGT